MDVVFVRIQNKCQGPTSATRIIFAETTDARNISVSRTRDKYVIEMGSIEVATSLNTFTKILMLGLAAIPDEFVENIFREVKEFRNSMDFTHRSNSKFIL